MNIDDNINPNASTIDDDKDNKDNDNDQKDNKNNLWREFLKTAVTSGGRGLQQTGHLIVFGSPSTGKTTLVGSFKKLQDKFVEMKKFLMMRYSYSHIPINVDHDDNGSYNLLNIWQIAEPSHADVLDVVIPINDMSNISYLICLDISKPSLIQIEYNKWMKTLINIQNKLIQRLDPIKQKELKIKIYKHIQDYTNPKDDVQLDDDDMDDDDKTNDIDIVDIQKDNPSSNLGVPIIVVLTKCDLFRKHFVAQADAEDHFEIMCSYIRLWCIEHGSASFSMKKGLRDQAQRILSYIEHRIFNTKFDRGPNAVVKLANLNEKFLFIPSGFDSIDTIKAQNPNRNLQDLEFTEFFKPKAKKKKKNQGKPKVQSDENDTFLKKVVFDLKNGDNRSHVTSGANRNDDNNGNVGINTFFQRLLNPNQKNT